QLYLGIADTAAVHLELDEDLAWRFYTKGLTQTRPKQRRQSRTIEALAPFSGRCDHRLMLLLPTGCSRLAFSHLPPIHTPSISPPSPARAGAAGPHPPLPPPPYQRTRQRPYAVRRLTCIRLRAPSLWELPVRMVEILADVQARMRKPLLTDATSGVTP